MPKLVITMAASSTFDDLIEELVTNQVMGPGNDDQRDVEVGISVSSVHTSDLSDFDDAESLSSKHEDFSTESVSGQTLLWTTNLTNLVIL